MQWHSHTHKQIQWIRPQRGSIRIYRLIIGHHSSIYKFPFSSTFILFSCLVAQETHVNIKSGLWRSKKRNTQTHTHTDRDNVRYNVSHETLCSLRRNEIFDIKQLWIYKYFTKIFYMKRKLRVYFICVWQMQRIWTQINKRYRIGISCHGALNESHIMAVVAVAGIFFNV